METNRVRLDGASVQLIGACLGLEGEAEAVAGALQDEEPSVVGLALAPDTAPNVAELSRARQLGAEDEAYKRGLSDWGSVTLPAPAFARAVEAAETVGARVQGVDMPEVEYMDLHLDRIGILELTKRALRARWLGVRPPRADSPGDFCRAFDARLNAGPFRSLQVDRERSMAASLADLADEERVSCVVGIERLDGLTRALGDRRDP